MKLSKAQLDKLLAAVTDDVAELLKSEQEAMTLSKADPGTEAPAEKNPEGSAVAPPAPEGETGPDASASPEASSPAPAPEGSPAGVAPDASPDPAGDPGTEQGATPEVLQGEYMKLPVEELKMHFLACKAALMAMMGGGADEGSAPPDATPPGPDASPAPGPEASASPSPEPSPEPPMGKKEFPGDGNGGQIRKSEDASVLERLTKAEAGLKELDALRKSVSEKDASIAAMEIKFQDSINQVAAGFQKILSRPVRKSIQNISDIKVTDKPGTETDADLNLTKSEVIQRLNVVSSTKPLTKSERQAINKYCVGEAGIETVVALLK